MVALNDRPLRVAVNSVWPSGTQKWRMSTSEYSGFTVTNTLPPRCHFFIFSSGSSAHSFVAAWSISSMRWVNCFHLARVKVIPFFVGWEGTTHSLRSNHRSFTVKNRLVPTLKESSTLFTASKSVMFKFKKLNVGYSLNAGVYIGVLVPPTLNNRLSKHQED